MRSRTFLLLTVLVGVVWSGCSHPVATWPQRVASTQPTEEELADSWRRTALAVESDYVLALAGANRFFDAWRNRDQEGGLAALSPRLLKTRTEDEWRMAVCGCSNPHHEAYEITNGRRLTDGRYAFDVRLYTHYHNFAYPLETVAMTVKVMRQDSEDWRIDELPDGFQ